jgi:hypothetical protein
MAVKSQKTWMMWVSFATLLMMLIAAGATQAATLVAGDSSTRQLVQETKPLLPAHLFAMIGDDVTVVTDSDLDADVCATRVQPEKLAENSSWGRKRIQISAHLVRKAAADTICPNGRSVKQLAQKALVQRLVHLYDLSTTHWSNPTDRAAIRACEQKYPNPDKRVAPSLSKSCEYYSRSRGKISDSLSYRALSDYANGVEESKNKLSLRTSDLSQLFSPEQHFAVNAAEFLVDSEYRCRKPGHYNFFQQQFKFTPFWDNHCKPVQYIFTSTGGWGIDLNPERVYQVHYLFASKGQDFSSKWGHAMIRFVLCKPDRPVGPDCMKDEAYHVILSYRANVDDVIVSNWDGLTGKYPSQALFFSMPEIVEEYTRGQWRELISLPLNFTKEQKDMFVNSTLEHYWSYNGRYKFISNNCSIETDQLIRMVLPRNHPYLNTHSISPLGLYTDLNSYGFIDQKLVRDTEDARSKGLYYPSQKAALDKAYAKINHLFPNYQSLTELIKNTYAVDRHAVYEKLDSMAEIGAAYLVEKYAARMASGHLQLTAAKLLQSENPDPSLRSAITKMVAASEARLPWNLAGPGYGIPLQSEMISEEAIVGRVNRSQLGVGEYFKALAEKLPELQQEVDDVNANLELLTNLRRF